MTQGQGRGQGDEYFCIEFARMLSSTELDKMLRFILQSGDSSIARGQSGDSILDVPRGPVLTDTQPTRVLVEGYNELDSYQFTRLPREFQVFCHESNGTVAQVIQLLKNLCQVASRSKEFYLSHSREQWLRTGFKVFKSNSNYDFIFSSEVTEGHCSTLFTIQSNVVPCQPYWQKLEGARNEAAGGTSMEVYFPIHFLKEDESQMPTMLRVWKEAGEERRIVRRWLGRFHIVRRWLGRFHIGPTDPLMIWKIGENDIDGTSMLYDVLGQPGKDAKLVRKILWRGGIFARKEFRSKISFDDELEIFRRVGRHPHIVYSFGVSHELSIEGKGTDALWMEVLDGNLWDLICERVRPQPKDSAEPPFSPLDSMDILLQIAKAMNHVHESKVVHGDLKCSNVLTSHCVILGDVKHYIVKVADFGSAQIIESNGESDLRPPSGTTEYAAPEVLKARKTGTMVTCSDARKSDVYSFSIVAFEVLSGEDVSDHYEGIDSNNDIKEGVMDGFLRPNFSAECKRRNPDLIKLIERCWSHKPLDRPSFEVVTEELESIIYRLQNPLATTRDWLIWRWFRGNGMRIVLPALFAATLFANRARFLR